MEKPEIKMETYETERIKRIMTTAYAGLEKYNDKPRRRYMRIGRDRAAEAERELRPCDIANHRVVIAISPNGGETQYDSIRDAAKKWRVNPETISNYLRGKTAPPHGVLFRYAGKEAIVKIRKTRSVAVVAIDAEGKETRYSSLTEAAEATGTHKQTISSCLHGRYKTTGGYRWRLDNKEEGGKGER
jgi:hypothetical protein